MTTRNEVLLIGVPLAELNAADSPGLHVQEERSGLRGLNRIAWQDFAAVVIDADKEDPIIVQGLLKLLHGRHTPTIIISRQRRFVSNNGQALVDQQTLADVWARTLSLITGRVGDVA